MFLFTGRLKEPNTQKGHLLEQIFFFECFEENVFSGTKLKTNCCQSDSASSAFVCVRSKTSPQTYGVVQNWPLVKNAYQNFAKSKSLAYAHTVGFGKTNLLFAKAYADILKNYAQSVKQVHNAP